MGNNAWFKLFTGTSLNPEQRKKNLAIILRSGKEIINLSVAYMEEAIEESTGDKILVPIEC